MQPSYSKNNASLFIYNFVAILFLLQFQLILSQGINPKKRLQIARTDEAPVIDGILNDSIWKYADSTSGFTQYRPDIGVPADHNRRTIVQMAFNDKAIYIAAKLYDDPEQMMNQLTARDNLVKQTILELLLTPITMRKTIRSS